MGIQLAKSLNYLVEFKCIGSRCQDNCCIGWDVDFDKTAFEKYSQYKDRVLSPIMKNSVFVKEACFSTQVDYAGVMLKKHKRCPFLDTKNLCLIQSLKGEQDLSNVCASFPRYYNRVNGTIEQSATLSCPEIARIALLKKEGIKSLDLSYDEKRIFLTQNFKLNNKAAMVNGLTLKSFENIRYEAFEILKDKNLILEKRFIELGRMINHLKLDKNKKTICHKELFKKLHQHMLKALNPYSSSLSSRYLTYTSCLEKCIEGAAKKNWQLNEAVYAKGIETYYIPFMNQHGYIIENYFFNYMYKTVFPYSEHYSPIEMLGLMVGIYLLIKLHLVGLGMERGPLTPEGVVAFLSAFSKAVEHHHTFLEKVIIIFNQLQINTNEGLEHILA